MSDDLIQRLESATADSAELMREAFAVIYPEPAPDCEPAWRPENPKQPIYHAWKTRQIRFEALLKAGAYKSAALMLVPEICECSVGFGMTPPDKTFGTARILMISGSIEVEAPTPALATVIAALHTRNMSGS